MVLFEELETTDTKKKPEIDILCVHGGKFIAAEVKLSAIQLVQDSKLVDAFVRKINRIHPDVAMLSFEQYCEVTEEKESVKSSLNDLVQTIRSRIHSSIELKLIVAEDTPLFNDVPVDLGYIGERTDGLD